MSVFAIPASTRDIAADVIDDHGRLKIMPAAYYATTTRAERCKLCVLYGLYGLHTEELVEFLRKLIAGRKAIEIGSGNGVLAAALGIPATDNFMQNRPEIRAVYHRCGQAPISYGPNVQHLDALEAIDIYRPQVVIGSWITHKYRPDQHWRGGNTYAPDEAQLLRSCAELVLIANDEVHKHHPILERPYGRVVSDWLFSRAASGEDFVGIWRGDAGKHG